MSNMSYCRFQNTVNELEDCYNNFDDDDLSEEEERARKRRRGGLNNELL